LGTLGKIIAALTYEGT